MKKYTAYKVAGGLALAFFGLQFTAKPLAQKPVTGMFAGPAEVAAIFQRACYDCHSNTQEIPWFSRVAPVSWQVNKDVERAREVLNFSEWNKLSGKEQVGKLWGILNMVKAGKMPLSRYVLLHPGARVTDAEVATIKNYVLAVTNNDTALVKPVLPTSPNGIVYSDAFKHWKVISTTTLYDNSMRVVYGNDIAVKAIREENFHPWPDGAVVVKAVWEQIETPDGEVRPGKFINAQFMVKNSRQFKDTEGWGFAKFSGPELKPTGKTAQFAAQSCISCHRQLAAETGYLFNVPLKVNPIK